jgi:hypothetical protein
MNKMIRIFIVCLLFSLLLLFFRPVKTKAPIKAKPTVEFARGILHSRGNISKEHLHLFHECMHDDGELGVLAKAIVKRAHDSFHSIMQFLVTQDAISTTDADSAVLAMDTIRDKIEQATAGGLGLSRRAVWFTPNSQTVKMWATNPHTQDSANRLLHALSLLNE